MRVYVLEFLAVEPGGGHAILGSLECPAPDLDKAETRAKAMVQHVTARDRKPDTCIIRDRKGRSLRVVTINGAARLH